jgi:hypothetical protein
LAAILAMGSDFSDLPLASRADEQTVARSRRLVGL